jgi:hypothetical protein
VQRQQQLDVAAIDRQSMSREQASSMRSSNTSAAAGLSAATCPQDLDQILPTEHLHPPKRKRSGWSDAFARFIVGQMR